MTAAERYQEFLRSQFWLELSVQKKAGVTHCEDCGKRAGSLECHHLFYRDNWYDTKISDLIVICWKCHQRRHRKKDGRRLLNGVDESWGRKRLWKLIRKIEEGCNLGPDEQKFMRRKLALREPRSWRNWRVNRKT